MTFITINKLFEQLPESELKAVQVYFDDYICDKFSNYLINVQVLFLSLVYKDNAQKLMTYKEFRELFPGCKYIKVPKKSFKNDVLNSLDKRLMKVYVKADRIKYKSSFYHECIVINVENQSKLNEFVNARSQAKSDIVNKIALKCTINDEDIDPDAF
ncbi:hypothetical protein M9Y10_001198 [Tritrichomonas musculus]|uniref:Initiator binding domain-containing protein n=1 Tax=Tritrichomonas musculus TaxID=1915356 RepID=A0ABR2L7D1_9EUKA